MTINPEIMLQERQALADYFEKRCLALAQVLADRTAERDQALADRDAYRSRVEALEMELRVTGEHQGWLDQQREEVPHGISE